MKNKTAAQRKHLKLKTNKRIALLLLSILGTFAAQSQQLAANFRTDKTTGCAPAVVSFQDLSFGNPTAWLWDFGNGNTSTLKNPATSYLKAGKYTITLIITNAAGLKDTMTKVEHVNIFDNPKANFYAATVSGCSPVRVQLMDSSVADTNNRIVQWAWDLGDGNLINAKNPLHVYRGSGDFAVTLKVTDDKGCSGLVLKPKFVNVTPGVKPDFTNPQPSVCTAPATVNFSNRSTGPGNLTYTWLFGDGATSNERSPAHNYTTNDSFNVKLVVSSSEGCFDTLSRPAAVILGGFTTDFQLKDSVCPGGSALLLNNSKPTPSASRWLFPDGTTSTVANPQKAFPNAGPVQIRLINSYGVCNDTLTKTINISAPPTISFTTADTAKCIAPLTATFTNNTVGAASYFWEFGDSTFSTESNPIHTFTELGTYNITLTATSPLGCVSKLTKNDYIKIRQPQVNLAGIMQNGCIPYLAKFKPAITSVERITSYKWDFGDGQSSTDSTPSHTYTNIGDYNVTLTITTASGCTVTQTLNRAVRAGTKPKAAFTATPLEVCASTSISFNNQSTGADEYLWLFGDGGSSKDFSPKYEFSDTGNIDVTLIAFSNGCGDTLLKPRYVYIKPPIANFSVIPDCDKPLEYRFADKSIGAESWNWDFGDGTTFVGQTPPMHVFPRNGSYVVKLTVSNNTCTHTKSQTVLIGPRPLDFDINTQSSCKPANVQLKPVNSNLDGVASLVWVFDNGSETIIRTSSKDGLATTINTAGIFDLKLVTIDTFGCRRDSVIKVKRLRVFGPNAEFDSPNRLTCAGSTVDFVDKSKTDGTSRIVKWEWSFGINNTDTVYTSPPFTKRYDSVGTFNVRLKVTDSAGCSDALIKRNFVTTSVVRPTFIGEVQTCPNGTPLQFRNTTPGAGAKFLWDFGDGDTSNLAEPRHAYKDTGKFNVTLWVTNNLGCKDSTVKSNFVYSGRPKASFDANNFISFCTPYEAKFTNTSTYATSLLWNLGQGTSTLQNPQAYYTTKGTYNIKLVATSPGGCKDSTTFPLVVRDPEDAKLNYVAVSACSPLRMDLEAFEEMNGRFIWDFGDGNVIDTSSNKISHLYTDFGSYLPSVILYEPAGCVLTLKGRDTINAIGVKAKFGVNQNLFCDEGMLRIIDSTSTNDRMVHYKWDFGDGATSTASSPMHFYNTPGDYLVQLITETPSGCKDTSAQIPIRVSITPRIELIGDTVMCERERRPYAGVLHNLDSTQVQWKWQLPNGSTTTVKTPGMLLFPNAGSFTISTIANNADGCADTIVKRIRVHPRPEVAVPPLYVVTAGQQVLLQATYSSSVRKYFWSPPTGLNCTDCPQPIAAPKNDTRYTINVLDSNNCHNSAETQVNIICPDANVFAPNTFSPNGDGANDVFYLRGEGLDRVRLLRVFNRWGEVVFERRECPINDATVGWDGRYKGGRPQPDVYVFQAEVYCISGEIVRIEGNVALIQ
jgi:gliding motility-associated-like protein